jgi:hypothetical protein
MSDTNNGRPGSVYTKRHIDTEARKSQKALSQKIRDSVEELITNSPDRSVSLDEAAELITGKDRNFRKLYAALNKTFPEYNIASIYEQHLRHRVRNYLSGALDEAGERAFVNLKTEPDENHHIESRYYVRKECSNVMLENAANDRVGLVEAQIESVMVLLETADHLEVNKLGSMSDLSADDYVKTMTSLRTNAKRIAEASLIGLGYQNKRLAAPQEKVS